MDRHLQPYERALNGAVRGTRIAYRGVGYLGVVVVMSFIVNAVRHALMGSQVVEPTWYFWACVPVALVITELMYGWAAFKDEQDRRGGS